MLVAVLAVVVFCWHGKEKGGVAMGEKGIRLEGCRGFMEKRSVKNLSSNTLLVTLATAER